MRYFSTFIAFIAVVMITGVIDAGAIQLKIVGVRRWLNSKKQPEGKSGDDGRVKRMKMV